MMLVYDIQSDGDISRLSFLTSCHSGIDLATTMEERRDCTVTHFPSPTLMTCVDNGLIRYACELRCFSAASRLTQHPIPLVSSRCIITLMAYLGMKPLYSPRVLFLPLEMRWRWWSKYRWTTTESTRDCTRK